MITETFKWWAPAVPVVCAGFNEPDNSGQANLTPLQAATYWPQVQAIAASAKLTLVSPALTYDSQGSAGCVECLASVPRGDVWAHGCTLLGRSHWSVNGSDWLDQFLGNCTAIDGCEVSLIKYIAVHDYSGDAAGIVDRAQAFQNR